MFTLVICVIDLRTHQPLNVNCYIQRAFSSVERMLICNKLKRAHTRFREPYVAPTLPCFLLLFESNTLSIH
jgi:hypothetical protein